MRGPQSNWSTLLRAVEAAELSAIELLLSDRPELVNHLGLHPDVPDDDPWTPLTFAAYQGHAAVCQLLLKAGADLDDRRSGTTALEMACGGPHVDVVLLLLAEDASTEAPDGGGWSVLHHAASGGTGEIARLLIAAGAPVGTADARGRTPLHIAASSRNLAVADLLIGEGASMDARDFDGRTPVRHVLDRTGLIPSTHRQPEREDERRMKELLASRTS